jgi:hypothetical protein
MFTFLDVVVEFLIPPDHSHIPFVNQNTHFVFYTKHRCVTVKKFVCRGCLQGTIQHHDDTSALVKYGAVIRNQEHAAKAEAEKAEGLALQEKARRLRLKIVDEYLHLCCPRCATKFYDYTGCNALF